MGDCQRCSTGEVACWVTLSAGAAGAVKGLRPGRGSSCPSQGPSQGPCGGAGPGAICLRAVSSCSLATAVAAAVFVLQSRPRQRRSVFSRKRLQGRSYGDSCLASGRAAVAARAVVADKVAAVESTSSIGIIGSVSDLPKTEALGIELRASAALAFPVSVIDGSSREEPFRLYHDPPLGSDAEVNLTTVSNTIQKLVEHFNWRGVVGCSITPQISKLLNVQTADFSKPCEVGGMISACVKGKVSFFHTVMHTDAAAYNELVWGITADKSKWSNQVVMICTLGRHVGAVLFNDGHRVRNSPLYGVFITEWQASLAESPDWIIGGKFRPPQPGSALFDKWAGIVDSHIAHVLEASATVDRVILIPTGRTAALSNLSPALLPKLPLTQKALTGHGNGEVTVVEQREGSVVEGVAIAALVELETVQVLKSLEPLLNGAQALYLLSEAQLRVIFDKIDEDATGFINPNELRDVLRLFGIERDMDSLLAQLDVDADKAVSFQEFVNWWRREVSDAQIVLITSSDAWKRILGTKVPPAGRGFSHLILLEVTFTFCRSCKSFDPKFRRFAKQYGNVRFVQLTGNSSIGAMDLCTKSLGVKVSPAFFVYRRGESTPVAKWTGANPTRFVEKLNECLIAENLPIPKEA